jgi:hypothetical protein
VLQVVGICLDFYKGRSRNGRRFAEILTPAEFNRLAKKIADTLDQPEGEGLSC